MGVNSLPKTVTRQRRNCDLNPGPTAPESSTLTTRLPSHRPDNNLRKSVFLDRLFVLLIHNDTGLHQLWWSWFRGH